MRVKRRSLPTLGKPLSQGTPFPEDRRQSTATGIEEDTSIHSVHIAHIRWKEKTDRNKRNIREGRERVPITS